MEYYFYNTDGKSIVGPPRFNTLIEGGFAATGGPRSYGELLGRLEPGDRLLMYENGIGVVAVGDVLKRWDGKSHTKLLYYKRGEADLEYRIDVDWFINLSAVPIAIAELKRHVGYTPQGTLHRIVKGRVEIKKMIDQRRGTRQSTIGEDLKAIERRNIPPTTKEALVNARLGQGAFRTQVLREWGECCSVTRSVTRDAIRASHIKPWSESTDEERLDPENGLPLVANFDALFDSGWISFESSGRLIVSSELSFAERQVFNIGEESLTKKPTAKTAGYLAYHRKHVFRK